MQTIIWLLNSERQIGEISRDIYGGFVEHLGRNVYGGVYDPASPTADEDGFRRDVLDLIRRLDMPITRYPGGCYVDTCCWEDGVGPVRKAKLDPAWHQLEPNTFGLDEFMRWADKANTRPLVTINIGSRSVIDTQNLYEYCNFPRGTYWSDMRRANGHEEPYRIREWCLGNELYGSWEVGQMSAADYGRLAREHAKLLKKLDPECRLIVCGTPDDQEWNRTVLDFCGEYIDRLSLHDVFCHAPELDERGYLNSVDRFEKKLTESIKICRTFEAVHGRRIAVSVDEWIIWDFKRRMRPEEEWTSGMHLLEQDYTILEALIAGSLFSCFHRHADTVDLACLAQSVNVIAPIRTEPDGTSWRQSIYFPFELTSRYGRGLSLEPEETGNEDGALYGSAVLNREAGELTLFLINRRSEPLDFRMEFGNSRRLLESLTMNHADHTAVNSPGGEILRPEPLAASLDDAGNVRTQLPGISWNMLRIKTASNRFSCRAGNMNPFN